MKVSVNTIRQFTDIDVTVEELKEKINAQLGAIEDTIDLADIYKDALIVKVVDCQPHPNADRLSICRIDDGGAAEDVTRDDDGLVQVVCGAPNVRTGLFAVWLPPRSVVPATYADDEPFVLGARELRGVMSQGMLAAADELGLGEDHAGIIEIAENEQELSDVSIAPGVSFARAFGLDDTIIDIENKMFTHRPDLFGQLGVAREIAGIQGKRFENPAWWGNVPEFNEPANTTLTVKNEQTDQTPRLMATVVDGVKITQSPLWLQAALISMGSKPINNVVDVTNYIMLITGQPAHAYDYDALEGATLEARTAHDGETITLINGKTCQLDESDIVIADSTKPVGLAGIMGGADSEVSKDTTKIVLEVASFNMYALRRTSMRHGVFSDALTRFNKGQSPLQTDRVMHRLLELMERIAQGTQVSPVYDVHQLGAQYEQQSTANDIIVSAPFVNERLGLTLGIRDIASLLENVSINCTITDDGSLAVEAPFWRTDIELPEDIVEEVGRLYGFDHLPRELPTRSIRPADHNPHRELASTVRRTLASAGANEVLTYSFVHENTLKKAQQNRDEAYQLANALSPDLQFYRLSLTPSLLEKMYENSKAGHDEFALFEIGKAHTKKAPLDEVDGLPPEIRRIAFSFVSKKRKGVSAYYDARAYLTELARKLGLSNLIFKPIGSAANLTLAKPFAKTRAARVVDAKSEQVIGVIGEYSAATKQAFKLPSYSAGFELMPEAILLAQKQTGTQYRPLSRYPSTTRDVSFRFDAPVPYEQLTGVVRTAIEAHEGTVIDFNPVSIYTPDGSDQMTISLRLTVTPYDKTLSSDEANAIVEEIGSEVVDQLGASIV